MGGERAREGRFASRVSRAQQQEAGRGQASAPRASEPRKARESRGVRRRARAAARTLDELGGGRVGEHAVERLGREREHVRRVRLDALGQARAAVDELDDGLGAALALVRLRLGAAGREPLERREARDAVLAGELLVRVRVDLGHDDLVRGGLVERRDLGVLGREVLAVAAPRRVELDKGRRRAADKGAEGRRLEREHAVGLVGARGERRQQRERRGSREAQQGHRDRLAIPIRGK